MAAFLVVYLRREKKKRAAHNDWIFKQGVRGRATVVAASSSGTLNEMPIMSLVLDVEVPGQAREPPDPERDDGSCLQPLTRMQAGTVLPVYA